MPSLIVGSILIIVGGLNAVRPDILMRFHIWIQRVIMGATYTPSIRTYAILRVIGAIIMLFGFLVITGILEE